jgi:lysophospholipase L1-like esterase
VRPISFGQPGVKPGAWNNTPWRLAKILADRHLVLRPTIDGRGAAVHLKTADAKQGEESAMKRGKWTVACLCLALASTALALTPVKETWDYTAPMKAVAARFKGTPGVVIHIGDSITYANPYGGWARGGKGKTAEDKAVLAWMHTDKRDQTDGWYLAAVDRPGGRSDTAVSGIRLDEYLKGGKSGIPSLAKQIEKYNPQIVVMMLGTNDVGQNRPVADYKADLETAVKTVLDNGTILALTTLSPWQGKNELIGKYNEAIRQVAEEHGLPLVDFYAAVMALAPDNWNGTIIGKNDAHPTAANLTAEPTDENFRRSGYQLRGWLTVEKLAEVKKNVIDAMGAAATPKPAPASRPAAR